MYAHPSIERVQISMIRYRDRNNERTCAIDMEAGHVCRFYGVRRMGLQEVCLYAGADLDRRESATASLIPCDGCAVWSAG
jgi:hypothetical protein